VRFFGLRGIPIREFTISALPQHQMSFSSMRGRRCAL
jgi:hypothetical protein